MSYEKLTVVSCPSDLTQCHLVTALMSLSMWSLAKLVDFVPLYHMIRYLYCAE